ncbi:hypothetical protein HYH03_006876 [Edaphochlamys debaryana]|uniref:Protein kinase domain-containing protein n=1 Tax=Edaphochlamys debaryana TaxID=47281 RepID=A0A835Y2V8_9CHLO|nr:hypothetical protein HYH03_006876 [Edaphochlamys debaryana]|eukprot:KAG2494941.1 hypothetical protein HYH03_006876 [Edaphochlamys debaryana]
MNEAKEFRKLHSSPLELTGSLSSSGRSVSRLAQPPTLFGDNGSPSNGTGGKLPQLWKQLKQKFSGSSSSSTNNRFTRSSTSELPINGANERTYSGPKSPASPGPALPATPRAVPDAIHSACSSPVAIARNGLFSNSPSSGWRVRADRPPTRDRFGSAGNMSLQPSSLTNSGPLPRPMSPVADPLAEPERLPAPAPTSDAVPDSPPAAPAPPSMATGAKVLTVSPALPAAMRRNVWCLEDYQVSKRLYKGASSSVYKATCLHSGLPVALKVYFLARMPDNIVHMLKREIEIHAQLVHKHVAQLYAAFLDSDQRVVLVQEYAARGDLYVTHKRLGGRMQPDQVAELVMKPFLDALSYLHSKGICHRDIKPENILFTQNWRLLLADFGVSINLHQERAVTRAGTEGYMAPEVERCPLKADPQDNKDNRELAYSTAVDIWAVGVLAYELMVGFPPVVAPAPAAGSTAGFVRSEMTAAALHFPASVPPLARAFITAALAPDPADRPTASALLQHAWILAVAGPRRPAISSSEIPASDIDVGCEPGTPAGRSGPLPAWQPHPPPGARSGASFSRSHALPVMT